MRDTTHSYVIGAVKLRHKSFAAWARSHGFPTSLCNDLLHRYGVYNKPHYMPKRDSTAHAILRALMQEGFGVELKADGWNVTELLTYTSSDFVPPILLHLANMTATVCALGDAYACTAFTAVDEGGPLAIICLLDANSITIAFALEALRANFDMYNFATQSNDLITVWAK